jgi:murein L,D-transpeptidase YafK
MSDWRFFRAALTAAVLLFTFAGVHAQDLTAVSAASAPDPAAAAATPTEKAVSAPTAAVSEPAVVSAAMAAASEPAAAPAGPSVAQPSGHFELADRVVVRKSTRRLLLMRAEHVIAEYAIRLGLNPAGPKEREGDFRTPEGRYWLARRNQSSDFFLSIEVSYPNDNDRSRARKLRTAPGGSIMIHGLPNFPRKPADYYARNDWTDGCIAVSNSDMVDIWLRTRVGLPIEIRP